MGQARHVGLVSPAELPEHLCKVTFAWQGRRIVCLNAKMVTTREGRGHFARGCPANVADKHEIEETEHAVLWDVRGLLAPGESQKLLHPRVCRHRHRLA